MKKSFILSYKMFTLQFEFQFQGCETLRELGIMFDQKLTFAKNNNSVTLRALKRLVFIQILFT